MAEVHTSQRWQSGQRDGLKPTCKANPYLPLNQVNRVNNLVSMHRKCLEAVNNPNQDIGEFDSEAQKKIKGFRNKLVTSHTRNK